jgi:3'(2'), 5'-bisphosphate nucleotidase
MSYVALRALWVLSYELWVMGLIAQDLLKALLTSHYPLPHTHNLKPKTHYPLPITRIMLQKVIAIAREAGDIILKHYHQETEVDHKSDSSPLTIADLESNTFIRRELEALTPEIPIISEETVPESFDQRKTWDTFWLVDPLDGTKEFVKKTGEFTVNIGLISGGVPILGVIHVPVLGQTYFAADGHAGWESYGDQPDRKSLKVRELNHEIIDIVASRDHAGPQVKALADQLPQAGFKSMGSSLKFCLVASGEADVYLRDVPTMEWDTAAAHAILRAAGGEIYTLDGNVLTYNKESLRNPSIISVGDDQGYFLKISV